MLKLSVTSKKMLYILLALGFIAFGICFAFISKSLAFGIIFGVFVSIARIFLLEDSSTKALNKSPTQAKNYMFFHYLLRFAFVGFALIVSAKSEKVDILGTFIGIILLQPTAYICAFLIKDSDIPYDKNKLVPIEEEESFENYEDEIKGIRKTGHILKEMFK